MVWVMLREMGAMVFMAFWEALATPEGLVFDQAQPARGREP